MLALLLVPSFLHQTTTTKVELSNGASVTTTGGSPYQYWGTSDTYLDATASMENNGDSHVLEGGPGRTILLKFGDLERLGRCKVVKATLYLTPSIGGKPHLSSIRTVTLPWGEGPLRRPFFTNKPLVAADWSATWKSRHSGVEGMDWQQNGAASPGDSAVIDGATMADDGKEAAISGLEGAVQNMMDRWYQNNGFALMFSGQTEFFSSKNVTGKPRLVLELASMAAPTGPDLSVSYIEAKYEDSKANPPAVWPRDGSDVTYIAHVKNVGDAAADGFIGSWNVREKAGSGLEVTKKLAPGEETTVEVKRTYKSNTTDHRMQPLGFLIKPKGNDATAGNDYVEIQENAIPLDIYSNPDGMQAWVRHLNDDVLAHSRFSFAPEGALERFRVNFVRPEPGSASTNVEPSLAGFLRGIGLLDYGRMQASISSKHIAQFEGKRVDVDSQDRWPGLLGGGSTANEISVPGEIQLPYSADYNEVFDQYELFPTGLLAASEVAALNANLGKPSASLRPLGKMPGTVIVRALNRDGDILPNTELRFYQSKDGEIQTAEPAFRLITGDGGSVLLPTRTGSDGKSDHFGGLQPDGSNGVYLISATRNGVTDYAWLKAWQLCDSVSRTGKPAVFVEFRFNMPYAEVDSSRNLAQGAVITDSAKTDAAKLTPVADGLFDKAATLPNVAGAWIDFDLGKDQTVTEVDVIPRDGESFWKRFDIVTYFTGQTVTQASKFGHEVDFAWNYKVRPNFDMGNEAYLAYRGNGRAVRNIRIVCKEPGAKATPFEIRVYAAKQ